MKAESRALTIGALANLAMAFMAWYTFYLSNSEAILLDGNYSFIMFLSVLVALQISKIKTNKTPTFPMGQFFYEALYSFVKGLLILGVLIMAVTTAVVRILLYIGGEQAQIPRMFPEPILYYAVLCTIICYGVSFFFFLQNRSQGFSSIMLKTEQKASFIDGSLSLGIAGGIFLLMMGASPERDSFIPYLADSIFVLILASFLIKEPVKIIKESVIELAGGTLQDQNKKAFFEQAVHSGLASGLNVKDIFISKNGSRYIIIVYITTEGHAYLKSDLQKSKKSILESVSTLHSYAVVDLIPEACPLKSSIQLI